MQIAIEQNVSAHPENTIPRPSAVAETCVWCQSYGGAAVTDDDWRDRDLQPIKEVGLQERRHRDATAFDEHARATALAQQRQRLCHPARRIVAIHADDGGGAFGEARPA